MSLRLLPPALQAAILPSLTRRPNAAREAVAAQLPEYHEHADTLADDNERLTADVAERDALLERAAADKSALDGNLARFAAKLAAARTQIDQERATVHQATTVLARAEQRLEEAGKV